MTEQEKAEIRQIIKEEIDAKLTTNTKPKENTQVSSSSSVRNDIKSDVNIETVSPTY
jgi:hypothetical protein